MLPYLIVFLISIIATYNAQCCKAKTYKFIFHSIFAILPLILLAAYRDPFVGTDTENYIIIFQNAISRNDDFLNYLMLHPSIEYGFLFYNFCIAQFVTTIEGYFLITYGLIVGLAYLSAIRLRKYLSPHIFMMIYVFMFYSETLNLMRQSIAISFILLAVSNLLLNRNGKYILWTVFACLFHTSAIISIVIGATYWLTKRYPIYKHKLLYLIICAGVFVIAIGLDYFSTMGIMPIFEEKLGNHLDDASSGGISNSHIVIALSTLLFLLYTHKNNPVSDMMLLTISYTMLFYLSPSMNAILYRLVIYFNVMSCFAVAVEYKFACSKSAKTITKLLLTLYVIFYIFSIVISKTHEVIPYSSSLLHL